MRRLIFGNICQQHIIITDVNEGWTIIRFHTIWDHSQFCTQEKCDILWRTKFSLSYWLTHEGHVFAGVNPYNRVLKTSLKSPPLVPHICVSESSLPVRRQAIILANVRFCQLNPVTNISEVLIKIQNVHSQKLQWKYHLRNGGHFVRGWDGLSCIAKL